MKCRFSTRKQKGLYLRHLYYLPLNSSQPISHPLHKQYAFSKTLIDDDCTKAVANLVNAFSPPLSPLRTNLHNLHNKSIYVPTARCPRETAYFHAETPTPVPTTSSTQANLYFTYPFPSLTVYMLVPYNLAALRRPS